MSAAAAEYRIDITARDNALAIIDRMKRSLRESSDAFDGLGRSAQRAERNVADMGLATNALKGFAIGLGTSLAGAFSGAAFVRAANQFTDMQNSLRVAGVEAEKLRSTFDSIFTVAQRQGAGMQGLTDLFSRAMTAGDAFDVSSEQALRFAEGVGVAIRVAGTNATEASGALMQLGQALGAGTVRAEEFNSINERLYPVLQTVANGMREAEGSVSTLRQMVKDGEVSSEAFFRAFEAGRPILDDMASRALPTLAQAQERLSNSFVNTAGRLDETLEVSRTFGRWASDFSTWIDSTGAPAVLRWAESFSKLRDEVRDGNDALSGLRSTLNQLGNRPWTNLTSLFGGATTPEQMRATGLIPMSEVGAGAVAAITGRQGFGGAGWSGRGRGGRQLVSAADYAPEDDESGSGAGGGSRATRADPVAQFRREIEAINARTRALEMEGQTLGRSTEEVLRSKTAFDLREGAARLNVALTPDLLASIDTASAAFARQTAEMERQREAFRSSQELLRFAGTTASGFFSDIVSGGRNASEALMNVTKRLADMALQSAFLGQGPLAQLFGTAAPQGQVGGLMGLFASIGRAPVATGGPMMLPIPSFDVGAWEIGNDGLAVVHEGETIMPADAAEDFRAGRMGGATEVDVRITIDDDLRIRAIVERAATGAAEAAASQAIAGYDRGLYARMRQQEDAVI